MRPIGIVVIAFFFLAICIYATFDLRRDHNQINRIREECQRTHGGDVGKVKECMGDSALRYARQPNLP
jgi:hypothetical protein